MLARGGCGLRGGIWQNTCSKLTKTTVQLLFTKVSNSCKNLRLFYACVLFGVGTAAVWEVGTGKFRENVKSGSARPGPAQVARVHWTHHHSEREGTQTCWSRPEPVATHSEDAVTFRMSYLESAAAEVSAPGWKMQQHSLRRRSDPGVCRGVNGGHVASGRTCAHKSVTWRPPSRCASTTHTHMRTLLACAHRSRRHTPLLPYRRRGHSLWLPWGGEMTVPWRACSRPPPMEFMKHRHLGAGVVEENHAAKEGGKDTGPSHWLISTIEIRKSASYSHLCDWLRAVCPVFDFQFWDLYWGLL